MYLPVILLASVIFIAFATAIITMSLSNLKMATLHNKRITSMSIAEAGVNYYLWHLAHDNTDYCDGGDCPSPLADGSYGPFTHPYSESNGSVSGSYDLFITPPSVGSSITTVKSIGKVSGTNTTRTVITTIGMPSFTKYTLLVNNSELWVGGNEKIEGSVFVNRNGVRNDGEITEDVSSTETTYTSEMFGGSRDGIWGSGIFGRTKLFPVPAIDFNQLNVDILNIRNEARDDDQGDHYGSSGSGNVGYHVILKANDYEVRKVKSYNSTGFDITKYVNPSNPGISYVYPEAGVLFFEDNVWIEGTVDDQKVTVIAADPGASQGQRKRMIIPGNIKYSHFDGTDKIGLITQTDILLARNAPSDLEIDAAMIAKDGQIRINNYGEQKNNIKVYGSMAHNTGLIWTYCYNPPSCSNFSGYKTTQTMIDPQNVLNPPPKFPLMGTYAILSWREE